MSKKILTVAGLGVAMGLAAMSPVHADIKIGLLTDFSGPQGAFGPL